MLIVILALSLCLTISTEALQCRQCGIVMSSKHNKSSEKCLDGETEEVTCPNVNHTHCVINFFRDIYENTILILWRKCGKKEDIMPCAIFDVSPHSKGDKNHSSEFLLSLPSSRQPKKLKTDTSGVDMWKPLEKPVTPRPGLIQVCSVDAKDCDTKQCLIATSGKEFISKNYFIQILICIRIFIYLIDFLSDNYVFVSFLYKSDTI